MQTIQQILKSHSVNGVISVEKAAAAVRSIDEEREATVALLKKAEKQVGMYLGEEINSHLAVMTGTRFSSVDYHYEIPNGEQ